MLLPIKKKAKIVFIQPVNLYLFLSKSNILRAQINSSFQGDLLKLLTNAVRVGLLVILCNFICAVGQHGLQSCPGPGHL